MGALDKLKDTAKKVREAVYGVEVRDAIADGFNNVVDAQSEYELKTTVKLETKLNEDFTQFAEELAIGVNGYVDTQVDQKIVEVMDDLSDDNLRSEIQQGRSSAVYATNYASLDARFEADEAKLKSVSTEVTNARAGKNSKGVTTSYSNVGTRIDTLATDINLEITKYDNALNGAMIQVENMLIQWESPNKVTGNNFVDMSGGSMYSLYDAGSGLISISNFKLVLKPNYLYFIEVLPILSGGDAVMDMIAISDSGVITGTPGTTAPVNMNTAYNSRMHYSRVDTRGASVNKVVRFQARAAVAGSSITPATLPIKVQAFKIL